MSRQSYALVGSTNRGGSISAPRIWPSGARFIGPPERLDEMLTSLQQRGMVALDDGLCRTTRDGRDTLHETVRHLRFVTP